MGQEGTQDAAGDVVGQHAVHLLVAVAAAALRPIVQRRVGDAFAYNVLHVLKSLGLNAGRIRGGQPVQYRRVTHRTFQQQLKERWCCVADAADLHQHVTLLSATVEDEERDVNRFSHALLVQGRAGRFNEGQQLLKQVEARVLRQLLRIWFRMMPSSCSSFAAVSPALKFCSKRWNALKVVGWCPPKSWSSDG